MTAFGIGLLIQTSIGERFRSIHFVLLLVYCPYLVNPMDSLFFQDWHLVPLVMRSTYPLIL